MSTFWDRNAPLMSLQYVQRWALIQMSREQSVADHSFRCWVLARDLYPLLCPVPHNSYEAQRVELWALIHDADEHWTSDLPGHVKSAINKIKPGIFDNYTDTKFATVMPWFLDVRRSIGNTPIIPIVKICDLTESLLYMMQHCVRPFEAEAIRDYVVERLAKTIIEAKVRFPSGYEWDLASDWADEVIKGEPQELTKLRLSLHLPVPEEAP